MSKNSAIDIILRVRPHKNVYKGFSTISSIQASTNNNVAVNSSSPKRANKVT